MALKLYITFQTLSYLMMIDLPIASVICRITLICLIVVLVYIIVAFLWWYFSLRVPCIAICGKLFANSTLSVASLCPLSTSSQPPQVSPVMP
jgi:hypothetical protein